MNPQKSQADLRSGRATHQLVRLKNSEVLVAEVKMAIHFRSRLVGLLGQSFMPESQGIWFPKCQSIHSFFMRMKFDCIVLDREMKVLEVYESFAPWKIMKPVRKAWSILELADGVARKRQIMKGEYLHVGPQST